MKRLVTLCFLLIGLAASAQQIINTANTSMVIRADKGHELGIMYYGSAINESDMHQLWKAGYYPQSAYPAYGLRGTSECAVSVIQADGNRTLSLSVSDVAVSEWEGGKIYTITSTDPVYPVTVCLVC